MRVKARIIRAPERAARIAASLGRLADRWSESVLPSRFFPRGSGHPGPRYANLYLVLLFPGTGVRDLVGLARRSAALLERRKGLVLDWAAGFRKRSVWLLIKPWGAEVGRYTRKHFRLEPEDLRALSKMLRKGG